MRFDLFYSGSCLRCGSYRYRAVFIFILYPVCIRFIIGYKYSRIMKKPEWVEKAENVIKEGGHPREVLRSVLDVLDKYGFLDADWYTESDDYFK